MTLQPIRGTHDLLFDDCRQHRRIIDALNTHATRYGCTEIATPIFESTSLFSRTLGETSDVVSKEMYTFPDRNGDLMTLRPEGTAGIARAFVTHKLHDRTPLKVWYTGPMFRYERPQKGRQRQFHQAGVEFLGVADPWQDVEALALAWDFLQSLALNGTLTLKINSLGDSESRARYRTTLTAYLEQYRADLSSDSQIRLEKNPLRVLDSKAPEDQAIVANAPLLPDSLTDGARAFLEHVKQGLTALGIPFEHDPRLVRGLDYYTHTAFEVVSDGLGAQATVLAGGRYDGLVKQLGGPETPAIGWAAGLERLALLMAPPASLPRPVAVIVFEDRDIPHALHLAHTLRTAGHTADILVGPPGKRLKQAHKRGARYVVLLGPDEIAAGQGVVKDLEDGTQQTLPLSQLQNFLS